MKICLVSRELYPFQKAGIAVYIYNLAKCLAENNHKVIIITDNYRDIENIELHDNIKLINVDYKKISSYEMFKNFNLLYSYAVYKELDKLIDEEKIDLVEFSDYFGEGFFTILYKKVYARFNDIPIVLKIHTPSYECNIINNIYPAENDMTNQEDYCINNADFVYTMSYAMKEKICKRLRLNDVDVVYNMVSEFNNYTKINMFDSSLSNKKYILFVGRLEVRKGIELLIKAGIEILDKYNEIIFVLIGKDTDYSDGVSMSSHLHELIPDKYEKNFLFLGALEREQLVEYYNNAYLSVFPSIWEGFGNVCLEAMSCNSPVIVSDAGGMMEIIDRGRAGLAFESGNYKELKKAIIRLLEDETLRDKFKLLAFDRSKDFSNELLLKEQINFYSKTVNEYKKQLIEDSSESTLNTFIAQNWLSDILKLQNINKELKRIIAEWDKTSKDNSSLIQEINRVIKEWEVQVAKTDDMKSKLSKVELELEKEFNKKEEVTIELNRVLENWKNESIKNELLTKESNRIMKEWENEASKNDELTKELNRVMKEWENEASKNDQLTKELNRVMKEWENEASKNSELTNELNRVMKEWKNEAGKNDELTRELYRVIEQWKNEADKSEKISKELYKVIKDWELEKNKNNDVTNERNKAMSELKIQSQKYKKLEKELEDRDREIEGLRKKLRSRKWLFYKLIGIRKGE